jgi:lysozyme family protein
MSFQQAVEFVLAREGGYANDPADLGGETNYGISKRAHPDLDIKNLTVEQAREIYRASYWIPAGCDGFSPGWALAIFDTAVNCGVSRAREWWVDWPNATIDDYLWHRITHYRQLVQKMPRMLKFLAGWLKRLELLRAAIPQQTGEE